MEDERKFYEAIMQRKEKIGIKKWKEFLPTLLDPTNIAYLTMEDAFEDFVKSESVKFQLVEFIHENDKYTVTFKSLYTGNIITIKTKFNFSIT